ncbi:MAG: hypothetical protein KF743_14175 [Fimbriimonadaceae bacterium]|nr:hypothetical protein [Fimbriimonadaceae bacterium]
MIATTGLFKVIHKSLADATIAYGKGILTGTCRHMRTGELLTDWVTIFPLLEDTLETQRGRFGRHRRCRECGLLKSKNDWAHPAILGRDLDMRWLYLNEDGDMFADVNLIENECMTEWLPQLRFYPVPVLDQPLSGEVLPSDPGWTGEFKELRIPVPPRTKPERGIGLWL